MNIYEVLRRDIFITFDPILNARARNNLIKKIGVFFSDNSDVMRVIGMAQYHFWNGLEKSLKAQISTPSELGQPTGFYAAGAYDVVRCAGGQTCDCLIPVLIAMNFDEIGNKLPPEYLKCSWFVHMSLIEGMTGDMFVSGLGYPKAVFQINPSAAGKNVLSVEWIYSGRRGGISVNQPIIFQEAT